MTWALLAYLLVLAGLVEQHPLGALLGLLPLVPLMRTQK